MKKILFLFIVSLISWEAASQYRDSENLMERLKWGDEKLHVMLDTRFDFRYTEWSEAGSGDDELGFRGQSLRLWFEGSIIPGIRYRLRHRINKIQAPLFDGLADATDHAWIALDLGRSGKWTITIGKQSVQLGTYEYDYNGADVYLSTMVNSDFDGHQIGVNAAYRFCGQTFNLQVFNSPSTQFASEEYGKKALGGSLLWQGNIAGGIVKTRWGYSALQHSADKFYSWYTLGTQINAGEFTAELDCYLGERNIDYGNVTGDRGLVEVRDRSASVNIRYGTGKWRPFVKGIWDKRHDIGIGSDVYENFGVEATVEYYPFTGHRFVGDLRFHLSYSFVRTLFRGPWKEDPAVNRHTALAGIRWFFNVK